jgi:hypothetical protein
MRGVITNGAGIRTTLSITRPQSSIVRRNNRGTEHRARVAPWRRKLFLGTNSALRNNSSNAKRGARRLPVLLFSLGRPQNRRVLADYDWPDFAADAHRMRGVISFVFRSKPGGVIPPLSVASELTATMYAHAMPNAREITAR